MRNTYITLNANESFYGTHDTPNNAWIIVKVKNVVLQNYKYLCIIIVTVQILISNYCSK